MTDSKDIGGSAGLVDSMDVVLSDKENECIRVTYDSNRDSTGLAVVEVVAATLCRDPLTLTPLQSIIDVDALDTLTTELTDGQVSYDSVMFSYEGLEVKISNEGVIEAAPPENT